MKNMYSLLSDKLITINNLNIRIVTGSTISLFTHRKYALGRLFPKGTVSNNGYLNQRERHSKIHLSVQSPNTNWLQGVVY